MAELEHDLAGDYTLSTVSDGGTRLLIDGTDLIENWSIPGSPPTTANSAPIHLSAGPHQLALDYEHQGSPTIAPTIEIEWQCADCSQPITTATAIPLTDLLPAWFNQTSTITPAGRLSYSHYNTPAQGEPQYNLVQVGGSNLITSYGYDTYGRTTEQVMPEGNSSTNSNVMIAADGDLQGTPDGNYATTYTYYGPTDTAQPPSAPDCSTASAVNQNEQLETSTVAGEHSTTYVYDSLGDVLAKTNGAGTTCAKYNPEGRLTDNQAPSDSAKTSYTYDPSGAMLTATGPVGTGTGTVTTYYDEQGRLVDTIDANGAEAKYSYDADGNQLTRTAAAGSLSGHTNYTTNYTYNAADQLTSQTDPANNTYSFFYDSRGNLRGTQYPNGTFSWVDTNPDGWITDQYNRHGTINASTTTPPSDSSPLADYTYTYDEDGKHLSELRTSGSTSQTTTYTYDTLGRLSQAALPNNACQQYNYDLDSNRTQLKTSTTGCSGSFTTTSYAYTSPGVDELTSAGTTTYTYTTDGQVKTYGTTTLTWDGWGRLSTAQVGSNTITYTYDPTGALMQRTSSSPSTTINYLLGDLFETNATGTITTSYTDGPAGNLATFNGPPTSSSTPSFLYYDAHGNLAAEANTTGTLTANHTYDPFGAPIDAPQSNTTVHRFVGRWDKQYDTTTGLILMGARPYKPHPRRQPQQLRLRRPRPNQQLRSRRNQPRRRRRLSRRKLLWRRPERG